MATNSSHLTGEASVSEVLKMVVLEHRELRAQYREVTTRIRNLRIAVRTLRSLGGKGTAAGPGRESKVSMESDSSTEHGQVESPSELPDDMCSGHAESALRRAIRIAVLENSEVVSREEIYARILRRGSFSFPDYTSATAVLAEELEAMATQGELRRVEAGGEIGWQRTSSSPASSAAI